MIVVKTGRVLWRSNGQSRWLLSLMNVSISRGYSNSDTDSQPANQEQNNRPSEVCVARTHTKTYNLSVNYFRGIQFLRLWRYLELILKKLCCVQLYVILSMFRVHNVPLPRLKTGWFPSQDRRSYCTKQPEYLKTIYFGSLQHFQQS